MLFEKFLVDNVPEILTERNYYYANTKDKQKKFPFNIILVNLCGVNLGYFLKGRRGS